MKRPSLKQAVFYTAGAAASVASAVGTYKYGLHETTGDIFMAAAGAGVLGVAIYAGWDVVFNHKQWPRRIAALLVASSFSVLSAWTIYQNTGLPEQQQREARAEASASKQSAAIEAAHQRVLQDKAAAKTAIETQQADIRTAIADLKTLQNTDRTFIGERLTMVKKGIRPNANNAAIEKARSAMSVRDARITELHAELGQLTQEILKVTQQATPATDSKETASHTPALPQPVVIDYARLARAGLYDAMTLLFLLFGSWYRTNRADKEQLVVNQINQAADIAQAKITAALDLAEKLEATIQQAEVLADTLLKQQATTDEQQQATTLALAIELEKTETLLTEMGQQRIGMAKTLSELDNKTQQLPTLLSSAQTTIEKTNAAANPVKELLSKLQQTIVSANHSVAHAAESFAPTNEPVNKSFAGATHSFAGAKESAKELPEQLSKNDTIILLKNRSIKPNKKGRLTTAIIQDATGWGRNKAEAFIISSHENGLLERSEYGRGWVYFYPSERVEIQTEMPGLRIVGGTA